MLLAVFVLTILVTIPNAEAPVALLEGITLLAARRTHLGRGLILVGILVISGFNLSFRRFVERLGSRIKFLLDAVAFFSMLASMTHLTSNVAIPNALAGRTLLEGITFLSARRTRLCFGPIFPGGFGIVILPFHRFAERHGT